MTGELDVLKLVCERLEAAAVPYMLTGSFALAYYATPRMTRDLDLVVVLAGRDADRLAAAFERDFYVDSEAARAAVSAQGLFNLMHLESGVKVDLIVRKDNEYRLTEFERRSKVGLGGTDVWIVSREDLILSKLVWARDTGSELQRRDVQSLLEGQVNGEYLESWAQKLGVRPLLDSLRP
jgi:hypothetical protein